MIRMDDWGLVTSSLDYADMAFPVKHTACGKVHDAGGPVTIVGHYADCTRWTCPHCGEVCDDRPIGWGGNVEKLS